jgi:preprotein translocase subunit SecD
VKSGGLVKRNILGRFILIGATVLIAIVFFLPNTPVFKYMPEWWKAGMPDRGITLGLDLQGGLHLVYEVDGQKAAEITTERLSQYIRGEAEKLGVDVDIKAEGMDIIISAPVPEKLGELIKDSYSILEETDDGVYRILNDEVRRIKDTSVDQALETIRNRIDQFGVAEPNIHRQGDNEIVVQLPGVKDPKRAISIIGRTALLEFKIVDDKSPLAAELPAVIAPGEEQALMERFRDRISPDNEILFERRVDATTGNVGKIPMLLKKETLLTGDLLSEARVSIDTRYNEPYVSLTFNTAGAKRFAEVTGAHVQDRMAIVLDGNIYSAPVIREKISGGDAQISGSYTMADAKDLAIVLKAGALPAPVRPLQNVTVGPSLGRDSIEAGKLAGVIGALLVVFFMIVYYKLSGVIADFALCLNILLLLGAMASLNATLTLPGIAGIILAIGMAVDSNVLMFERMREELRAGKTPRAAVDSGYQKAFWTIFDSHVTTLITALVLFQFGTGPIKGFAVTLSLGVAINLFTALVGTKTVFDLINQRREVKTLSI